MRFSIILILGFSSLLKADVTAGLGIFSWQEKVPVILNQSKFDTNATFSSLGPSIGYETLITSRYRLGLAFSYHSGVLDILKLEGAVSPRHNFTAYWLSGKSLYRWTRSFAFGPVLLFSQKQIDRLPESTSFGMFFNFEYDIFEEVKIVQSLGSVGDSGSLAYSFNFIRSF